MSRTFSFKRQDVRRSIPVGLSILTILGYLSIAVHAHAHGSDDGGDRHSREIRAIREAVDQGRLIPLPRIMALALARVPGDIVRTELERKEKRLIYEVNILTASGRVREVKLDAETGTVLDVEDD